jgi:hypothetical protein
MVKHKSPEWWTAVFTAIIACTGALALIYAYRQLNESHNEAQIQHLLALNQEYEQEPMATYRRMYATKRLAGVEEPPEQGKILDFFETVALLVNRGYLKDTDVWENFGNDIFPLYADAREMIEQDRKDDPAEYSNLVTLMQRLETIETEHHGTLVNPSKEDIADFWKDEVNAGVGTPAGHHKHAADKP